MSTRTIPKNYRNVTGVLASSKAIDASEFESTLEKDFLTILEFDKLVDKFEVQPVTIEYIGSNGYVRNYTPDVLVHYRSGLLSSKPKTVLYEVKYRNDLKENWTKYRPKFKVAMHYAYKRNWKFSIITECEIRTPYLNNIKFLLRYRSPIDDMRLMNAMNLMDELRETDPDSLVAALATDNLNRAEVIYLVWQMLAKGYLQADITQPLTMKTRIWLPNA